MSDSVILISHSYIVLLLVVLGLAIFVLWVAILLDALRTPASKWQAAGQSQIIYILLMVFLNVVGSFVYVIVARPKLRAVSSPASASAT